jgi:Poly-beta-hydroxybutyrate polymerase (PhaC) N-terminus/PDZ domain
MQSEARGASTPADDIREHAAEHTLAANPLVGVRGQDILDSAGTLLRRMVASPAVAARQYLAFLGDVTRILTGGSELAPDAKDKRFADPAWRDSFPYRALAQCYLAWGGALNRFVDEAEMDKRDAERSRFVVSLVVDAMSPSRLLTVLAISFIAATQGVPAASAQEKGAVCGWIGAEVSPMTKAFAESLGMTGPYGAIFDRPQPGGPAARARIQAGDVLTTINGEPLKIWSDFAAKIAAIAPGTTIYLDTYRNRQLIGRHVRVGSFPCAPGPR